MAEAKKVKSKKTPVKKRVKKVSTTNLAPVQIEEAVDILEESNLHIDEIKKMNFRQVSEIIHFFKLENNQEKIKELTPYLEKLTEPAIEFAPTDLRVWTYFYEKYMLRALLAGWAFLTLAVVQGIIKKIGIFDSYITWQENFLMEMNPEIPEALTTFMSIPLIGGLLAIMVGWRILIAYQESNLNTKGKHAPRIRRRVRIIIVNKDGTIPGIGKTFLRGLFKLFPFVFLTLLSMQFSKSGRGIHDKIFNTYILRVLPEVTDREIEDFMRYSVQML
ncbi:MAG: hypothetical protein ABUK01_13305 [Leptospirales bacterium]